MEKQLKASRIYMIIETDERVIRKDTNTVINSFGEILNVSQKTVKKITADKFVQVYLRDNEEFYKLSKAEANVLSICWLTSVYYTDEEIDLPGNKVNIDSIFMNHIKLYTDLKPGTVYNTLASLVKKEMLIKKSHEKGIYYLNPKYFFKGTITDRTKIVRNVVEYRFNDYEGD